MGLAVHKKSFIRDVQHNCDISDARDHGIYSMCTMVLKLRNLYKWEQHLQPWQEPDPGDLLDWIETKENYWTKLAVEDYCDVALAGRLFSPDDSEGINQKLAEDDLVYGAGYGRSMKAVFFLAEQLQRREVEDCPVLILGKELVREMASPLAMVQDGVIYIHRESLRFFFWDQVQELRSSCRSSFIHTLNLYGLLKDGELDYRRFREQLDSMVDEQMDLFIYHEVGEAKQRTLNSAVVERLIRCFPGGIIELVCRTVKDILADTHPQGLLAYTIRERKEASLSFYVGLLDGLRKQLFPEIFPAWQDFINNGDWGAVEKARLLCRENNLAIARKLRDIESRIDTESRELLEELVENQILTPLGVSKPS